MPQGSGGAASRDRENLAAGPKKARGAAGKVSPRGKKGAVKGGIAAAAADFLAKFRQFVTVRVKNEYL